MITRLTLLTEEDREIVLQGLAQELEHAIRQARHVWREADKTAAIARVNRIAGLMTQIDGRLRPFLAA